jgi:hypothetical protein
LYKLNPQTALREVSEGRGEQAHHSEIDSFMNVAHDADFGARYKDGMTEPITLNIPHTLGKVAAHDRLDRGIGKIGSLIPGGGQVQHQWDGDAMTFTVTALGQTMACVATVFEDTVHAVVDLPPMLALFGNKISEALKRELPKLLT